MCFVLNRCVHFITPIYRSYHESEQENMLNEQNVGGTGGKDEGDDEDEDDFLTDQQLGSTLSNSSAAPGILSYGSSPGFKLL